jgi:hypothetical protein
MARLSIMFAAQADGKPDFTVGFTEKSNVEPLRCEVDTSYDVQDSMFKSSRWGWDIELLNF